MFTQAFVNLLETLKLKGFQKEILNLFYDMKYPTQDVNEY